MNEKKAVSKDDIISQVKIIEIAKEFKINLESVSVSSFDYKCKCPSKKHKNGQERTGSCFIDSKNNSFRCFGCNEGFNSIDFYMLCSDSDFSTSFLELKERVKEGTGNVIIGEYNNFNDILAISNFFRKILLKYPNDFDWIEELMKKTDQIILNIDPKDPYKAKNLLQKIKKTVKLKYRNEKK